MSVRLFHRRTRVVITVGSSGRAFTWCAFHRRPIAWADVFAPVLLLVGFSGAREPGGIRFGEGGCLHWTRGALWTTIRLQLPPCSDKKAALLAAGLLKAARYGAPEAAPAEQRQ